MQKINGKKFNGVMLLWTLILTVALSFVCIPDVMAAKSKNSSKVKSVKVTNIKGKSLTLKKGQTKTLKVKVVSKKKSTKVSQAVTYKSSAPKVVGVTAKGKITAKKVGTSKITVTSKANKKKKAAITVKVTASAAATAKITASVVNASTVKISLPKAKKLAISDFTVKKKALPYSKRYNKTCKLDNMTTSNNKDYLLVLEDRLYNHYTVQVTVKGVGTAAAAYNEGTFKYTDTSIYNEDYNESVDRFFSFDDVGGYSAFTVKELPKGIKWEESGDGIRFYGKPSEAGRFISTITAIDELGNTFTSSVTWLIGSRDKIYAAAEPSYYVLSDGEVYVDEIYVKTRGGSGSYKYELSGNTSGLTIGENSGEISGTLKAEGTYKLTVNVADSENPSYKTTAEVVIYVSQTVTINGMVKDLAGNAMNLDNADVGIIFKNKNKAAKYTAEKSVYASSAGVFSASLEAGTYDIEVYYSKYDSEDRCSKYLYSQKIITSKTGFDLTLPLRKIVIESSDPTIKAKDLGTWFDADGKSHGYGDIFYLKNGTSHKWTASNEKGRRITRAEVSFTVNAAATRVQAAVKSETVTVEPVSLGGKAVTITDGNYHYFAFTAPETKTYYFYSSENNRDGSLQIRLEDIEGSEYETEYVDVPENYGDNNVGISYSCEAGKTYYAGIRERWYEDYDRPVTIKLNVSETRPVYDEPAAESAAPEYSEIESSNDILEVPAESGNTVDEIVIPADEPEETPIESEETVNGAGEIPVVSEAATVEETVLDEIAQ